MKKPGDCTDRPVVPRGVLDRRHLTADVQRTGTTRTRRSEP